MFSEIDSRHVSSTKLGTTAINKEIDSPKKTSGVSSTIEEAFQSTVHPHVPHFLLELEPWGYS